MAADALGQFEQLVLTAVLTLDEQAYGVTIHARVAQLAHPRTVSLGAVYVTLDRLEDKGLVSSRLSDPTPERGGRAKRCYQVEAAGERALHGAALASRRMSAALSEVWGSQWDRRWRKA
jgi:DNA-binding PadR family transcriptional regulator